MVQMLYQATPRGVLPASEIPPFVYIVEIP
jgi:hypothetical protein